MRVVERTRHIDVNLSGFGLNFVADALKAKYPKIKIIESEDDYVFANEDKWFNSIEISPSDALKMRRANANLTLENLSEKTGIAVSNLSAMESGTRKIGFATAKKNSLRRSVARSLVLWDNSN